MSAENFIAPEARIYVAGHRGLVGSALVRALERAGYHNLLLRTRAELDLTDARAVRQFFAAERPEHVFLAAAKVGGILANSTYPGDFIFQNMTIQANVIDAAYPCATARLLFLAPTSLSPKLSPHPTTDP